MPQCSHSERPLPTVTLLRVTTYLDAIGEYHRRRAASDERRWTERLDQAWYVGPSFAQALSAGDHLAVIAEVKRRSPSKGWLQRDLDAVAMGRLYESAGAAAISVLTDQPHFGGDLEDLAAVRDAVQIPRLRKDFTVCENDVLDALEWGASAILLIVALLDDNELSRLHALARTVNLDVLVEVHDETEARRALSAGALVVGVNQRDLHSFAVDAARAERVSSVLPPEVVRVAESGLRSVDELTRAVEAGFDAVLVGEAFVIDADPAAKVREFAGVPRR